MDKKNNDSSCENKQIILKNLTTKKGTMITKVKTNNLKKVNHKKKQKRKKWNINSTNRKLLNKMDRYLVSKYDVSWQC